MKGRVQGLVLSAIIGLVWVAPAVSQDEGGGGPMPFVFWLHGEVAPEMSDDYNEALSKVISGHQQHDNGNNWVAYVPLTGGSAPQFNFFIPMQKVGEMDGWTPLFQILSDTHGVETAGEVMQTLSTSRTPSSRLLAYNSAVSNPAPEIRKAPPPFAWHLTVRPRPGMVGEYVAMARAFIDAHSSHEQGMNWLGYSPMVGGKGAEFHYFIAMDKLGDMDSWPPGASVMIDSVGAEEWQRMQKRLGEITDTHSEILVMSPPHSNPGAEDGGGG
jgi:hypothetical protein